MARAMTSFRYTRRGFTVTELALTIVVLGLLTMITVPRLASLVNHSRVNRTTALVAADLERAFAMAGRQRKPVRLSCACDSVLYRVVDRTGGTVRLTRNLAGDDESGVTALAFNPTTPVEIFPSGVASSPLTVTISAGGYARQVTMTSAGQVRIVTP
jgi:prepilin-type N-terminal cleavage/methylation domain-containing protein